MAPEIWNNDIGHMVEARSHCSHGGMVTVPPAHWHRAAHVAFGPARMLLPGELPRARVGRVLGRVPEAERRSGRGCGRDSAVAVAVAATVAAELWRHPQSSSPKRFVRV